MRTLILPSLVVTLLFPSLAFSQDMRQQRRQFIGDLLQTLIESQIDDVDPRFNRNPGVQGNVRPNNGIPVAGTRQLQDMRRSLAELGIQLEQLVRGLQEIQFQSPSARVLLADAMQVKALNDRLIRKANFVGSHREIVEDYRRLDYSWRVLVHKLRQSGGIDDGCLGIATQIHELGDRMCGCLEIQPSFNRAELVRLMSSLNLSFQHLLQDLYYDNRNDPKIERLIREGQELFTKINQASSCVEREPYDALVAIYKDCVKDWRRYVRKLRPYMTERTRRDIQEIESIARSIHEQLWLPIEIDVDYILDVTRSIEADTGRLFTTITLEDLMGCENPALILKSAREFQQSCGRFVTSLENGLEGWMWDFQLFNVQWNALRQQCAGIQQGRVVRRINEIDSAMLSLTESLGQGPIVTRHDLIQLTAQLDEWCNDLYLAARRDIANFRDYTPTFRQQYVRACEQLHDQLHHCHQALIVGGQQANVNAEFESAFQSWRQIKQMVRQCNDGHRAGFSNLRREIEPLMVKLQVVFGN